MHLFVAATLISFALASAFAGIIGKGLLHNTMVSVCLIFAAFAIVRQISFLILAFFDYMGKKDSTNGKRSSPISNNELFPKISIIVPAYNEELVIEESINSLLKLDYPNYDIYIIDDGSNDNTYRLAKTVAERSKDPEKIKVVSQENGGKSKALNNGIRLSDAPYVLCVDADSTILPGGLRAAIAQFNDPSICAIAGFIQTKSNQKPLIARLQQIEYSLMQYISRAALSGLKCVPIVPGPAGLFRRDIIIKMGCYESGEKCFAEDAELSMKMLANGWGINSERQLIATTQAPENLNALLRQRYRWLRGSFQAFFNNFEQFLANASKRSYWLFIYLMIEFIFIPIAGVSIALFFIFNTMINGIFGPLAIGILILIFLELLGLIFITKQKLSLPRRVLEYIIYRFTLSILILFWSYFCLIDEVLDSPMTWDKLERY